MVAVQVRRIDLGDMPALVCGVGPPLLWLGGLSPESGVDRPTLRRTNLSSIRAYTRTRTMFYVGRRVGLARGLSMAALTEQYADAIRAGFGGGPVDIAGVSTGGSIAQQLAASHPQLVRALVLLSTGCRLGPLGREGQRRAATRVRRGAHRQAWAVMGADLVPPHRGQLAAAVLAAATGPHLFPHTRDLDDMATVIEAEDAFDLATCPPIAARTLLVYGTADRFYSPAIFAETARLIPDCRTHPLEGRGHITALAQPSVPRAVLDFLDEDPRRLLKRRSAVS